MSTGSLDNYRMYFSGQWCLQMVFEAFWSVFIYILNKLKVCHMYFLTFECKVTTIRQSSYDNDYLASGQTDPPKATTTVLYGWLYAAGCIYSIKYNSYLKKFLPYINKSTNKQIKCLVYFIFTHFFCSNNFIVIIITTPTYKAYLHIYTSIKIKKIETSKNQKQRKKFGTQMNY